MQQAVRLFIAVHLPYEVRHAIIKLQKDLASLGAIKGSYPLPGAMHLTLKFIGAVPDFRVNQVQQVLRAIPFKPMLARTTRVAAFGKPEFPKIIYVGIECPELSELVAEIEKKLDRFCESETREFVGHLTVARVRSIENINLLHEWISTTHVEQLSFTIDHFALMQSQLSSYGPEHTEIERFGLVNL